MSETASIPRRPFTGSCQCGNIKYIVFLKLPATAKDMQIGPKPWQRMYRCNCNPCRKLGILHIRLPHPPDDFVLISPLDPVKELSDYTCNEEQLHFLFCPTCGARPFVLMGKGQVSEKDLPSLGVSDEQLRLLDITDGEKKQKVWSPMSTGWMEGSREAWVAGRSSGGYLSVNAYTLDVQDGIDLRVWKEEGWISYVDSLDETEQPSYDRPHRGGAY